MSLLAFNRRTLKVIQVDILAQILVYRIISKVY